MNENEGLSNDELWAPASAEPSGRRLYRSRNDRMMFGVCGGIANYFGIDSTLVRLAFMVLVLGAGSGVLLYFAAWLIIPDGGPDDRRVGRGPVRLFGIESPYVLFGLALVALGALFLVRLLLPDVLGSAVVPIVLIAIGIGLVLRGKR
jgi:phage shock protein C